MTKIMGPCRRCVWLLTQLGLVAIVISCENAEGPIAPQPDAPRLSASAGGIIRIHGTGKIGLGDTVPGQFAQTFSLDVRSDLTGSLDYTDYSVVRPDGSVGTLSVDPLDSQTGITVFRDSSTVCDPPVVGVEFDGTGRLDTGELVGFSVITCDVAMPGDSFSDEFWMQIPSHTYSRRDRLSAGDLTKDTLTSSGTDYYVSPTGDDAVSCTQAQNIATPKRTLNNAVSCLSPGSTLLIRGGTYAEALLHSIPAGTSWAAPVTLKAYPGETVIMRPVAAQNALNVLRFMNPQAFIVIDGLVLDAATVTHEAVKITWTGSDPTQAAHHIRIMNCEVMNAPFQGILVDGSNNEFINLKVHNNGGPVGSTNLNHGIYIKGSNNLIDGGDFYSNASYGVHVYSDDGGVHSNVVRNTKIHGNNKGFLLASGNGNLAYNNLVYRNNLQGLDVAWGPAFSGTKVYNNTIYGNGGPGIYVGPESSDAIVRNNIIYQNGPSSDQGFGTIQDHNLIDVDPKFVNAAADDFHLQPESPAIDSGATLAEVTTDFDGRPRPQGAAYDIGAYESAGASSAEPNEPAGFTLATERSFNAKVENGWTATTSSGFSIASDATALKSPSSVGQMLFPAGASSYDPGWTEFDIRGVGYTKLYVSFWLKVSSNWQGHPIVNKVHYIWIHGMPVFVAVIIGKDSGPLRSEARTQDTPMGSRNLAPNLTNVEIVRGHWQRWEIVLVSNTGGNADGQIHWWIDGTKVGEYRDVIFGSSTEGKTWQTLSWRPIWGGAGGVVVEDMYMWMDHYYASGQ